MKELSARIDELEALNVNVFIGPNIIDIAHIQLFKEIENLFGLQSDPSFIGQIALDYRDKEFVIASFNSYRGVIKSVSDLSRSSTRYNIYKKGKIWSSAKYQYGRNFYYFLNSLARIFDQNPVNTFSEFNYRSKNKRRYIRVLNRSENDSICFPDLGYYLKHEEELIKTFASKLQVFLSEDVLMRSENDFQKDAQETLIWINDNCEYIIEKITADQELNKCVKLALNYFDLENTNDNDLTQLLIGGFIYSYNHFPFDLYLFYPEIETEKEYDNFSVLMIAKEASILKDKVPFLKLVNEIEKVAELENSILRKIKESTDFQLRWQLEYQKRQPMYDSYRSSVENICKALCRQYNIKAEVTSRIKTFPSFFNKIYNRSNDPKETFEYKGVEIHYSEVLKSLQDTNKYFDSVFNDIRDVAGVRIICVYNSDVEKLRDLFIKMINEDIEVSNIKEYRYCRDEYGKDGWDKAFNYRGVHVTVKPGETRLKLTEFKGYKNLQCEIQIRTILAHGWSDVQHPMEYKSTVPLKEIDPIKHLKVEKSLEELSKTLRDEDEKIEKLKKEVDAVEIPMDKNS